MKKSTIIVIVVIVLIAIWGITSYNGMVKMDESVSTAWSNVENQYQRRSDLIPNLVNTGIRLTRKRNFSSRSRRP